MTDLYTEILQSETMEKTVENFVNEIVEDPTVRDAFFEDYASTVVRSMSIEDLIANYTQRILDDLYVEFDENQEEAIVQECADLHPEVLEKFGVMVEEVGLTA